MSSTDQADLANIDLTDASVWEQGAPHEWLDRLRTEDPVHWHEESDGPGFWALTQHSDVLSVSSSPSAFSSYVGGPLRLDPPEDGLGQVRMVIIGMDPPEHRTFRNIVAKAFTPRMIARLESSLRAETARVVGELRDGAGGNRPERWMTAWQLDGTARVCGPDFVGADRRADGIVSR